MKVVGDFNFNIYRLWNPTRFSGMINSFGEIAFVTTTNQGTADHSMYSTFLTASPGSVLFSRSTLLKRKDLASRASG